MMAMIRHQEALRRLMQEERTLWPLGLVMLSCACAVSALGMLLMKHSLTVGSRTWWLAGFLLLGPVAFPFNAVAFSITPITLIAPFGNVAVILCSVGLAYFGILSVREEISKKQIQAVGLLLLGAILVGGFGPHGNNQVSFEEAAEFRTNIPFMVVLLTCVFVMIAYLGTQLSLRFKLERSSPLNIALLGFSTASLGAFVQLLGKILSEALRSALVGSGNVLRSLWSLLGDSYVVIVLVAALGVLQLYLQNCVLAGSEFSFAVPLLQSLRLTLTMATGGTFFYEFEQLSASSLFVFLFGTLFVTIGIGWLALIQGQPSKAIDAIGNATEAIELT